MKIATDQMTDAIGAVLSSLVDFPVALVGEGSIHPETSLTGIVTISGDADAVVVVRCDRSLAVDIAAAMFAMPPEDLADGDIVDALGEVTNMSGGSVKALLDGTCRLGLPVVTTGTAASAVVVPGAQPAGETVFTHEGRFITVSVLLADEDAAIERWVDRITGK